MLDDDWKRFLRDHRDGHYGELYQDVFVLFMTDYKRRGFFVEFGAMDGLRASNTLLLETKYGWTGILSEPNPRYNKVLAHNRRCKIDLRCVSDQTGATVKFQCADNSGYPGMVGHIYQESRSKGNIIDVETVDLNDLFAQNDAPDVIDYVSVDTDGSEPMIMRAFDFSKNHVNLWSIEHNQAAWRQEIHDIMLTNGYTRVLKDFSGYDDWYAHKSMGVQT